MSIAVLPCNTRCLNVGDVAMLQVCVRRLRARWPSETLEVFTSDPAALARHCPGVVPVELPDQPAWCTDRYIGGRIHDWLPGRLSDELATGYGRFGSYAPAWRERLIALRARWRRDESTSFARFTRAIGDSRLLVVSGAGGLADFFRDYTNLVVLALQCAETRSVPAAMMGQGVGPIDSPDMRMKVASALGHVPLIALRERRASLPLLRSLGVRPACLVETGDDAIELAYESRPTTLGKGLGLNLRLARSAGTNDLDIALVVEGMRRFTAGRKAPILPVPIAFQRDLDLNVIRTIVTSLGQPVSNEGPEGDQILGTPLSVIRRVGQCRLVVTGAYHAAVFALAQGVPAVCVARSAYFRDKFLGLADEFGIGCHLVSLDETAFPERLSDTLNTAWLEAHEVRPALLAAAERQIAQGKVAYDRLALRPDPMARPDDIDRVA